MEEGSRKNIGRREINNRNCRYIVLSPEKIPVLLRPADNASGESLTPEASFLPSLIDGRTDIKSILWLAPVRSVDVLRALKEMLDKGLELLGLLKEDSDKLGASDLHELMRAWENYHRMFQAEAHVRTMLYREETRWPGYYFRADFPKIDEANWKVFVNCRYDAKTGNWEMSKKPILPMS